QKVEDYALAINKVRYQGEPVAAVVAESRHAAEDAAELVEVDYDPLPPLMTPEHALKGDSLLHEEAGTNRMWNDVFECGEGQKAFQAAVHSVHIGGLHFPRFSSTPLENNVVVGQWNIKEKRIQYFSNQQFPAFAAQFLSPALGVRIDQIGMRSIDIGGGFGNKIHHQPYLSFLAMASHTTGVGQGRGGANTND